MTLCTVNFPSLADPPPASRSPSFPILWGYHFLPADLNADEAAGNNDRVGNLGDATTPRNLLLQKSWKIWEALASKLFILRDHGKVESTRSMKAWPATYKHAIKRQGNYKKLIHKDHRDSTDSMVTFGRTQCQNRNFKNAIELHEAAILESVFSENHANSGDEIFTIGLCYLELGKFQHALDWFGRALRIKVHAFGGSHIETVNSILNIGCTYFQLGICESALWHYERGLTIIRSTFGPHDISTSDPIMSIGSVYLRQGRYREALRHYSLALQIKEKHFRKDHISTAVVLNAIGLVYDSVGMFRRAVSIYERAVRIQTRTYGETHHRIAATIANMGIAFLHCGDTIRAKKHISRAHGIFKHVLGKEHVDTLNAERMLEEVYRYKKRHAFNR